MINLEKGQRVNVELQKFTIGLGWDTNSSSTGVDFDLDASAFILGENKKLLSDENFVWVSPKTQLQVYPLKHIIS